MEATMNARHYQILMAILRFNLSAESARKILPFMFPKSVEAVNEVIAAYF